MEGLPASDLLGPIALAEVAGSLRMNLKHREDFNDELSNRLLRRSRPLGSPGSECSMQAASYWNFAMTCREKPGGFSNC